MKPLLLDINLMHEEHAAVLQRARDPLKLGMLVVLVVAVILVVFYMWVSSQSSGVGRQVAARASEEARLKPLAEAAKTEESELTKRIAALNELQRGTQKRFFVAPILEQVLRSARADIQINSLDIKNEVHGEVNLTLDATSVGFRQEPRMVSDDFRAILEKNLQTICPEARVEIRSVGSGSQVTLQDRQYPTAQFTLHGVLVSGTKAPKK